MTSFPIHWTKNLNSTILYKNTPLWKRIGEQPEIQTGCYRGSRSTASVGPEAQPEWGRRGHGPHRKNLSRFFAGVLYQSQLFENKRKEQSDSCGVVFSHWPRFNVTFCDCETIRLKHATLLAKLPINADNTSWGVAWMKCKGAAFLKKSTNSDETFLRWLFAWSIAETSRNILGQDIINPKRITQWSVM